MCEVQEINLPCRENGKLIIRGKNMAATIYDIGGESDVGKVSVDETAFCSVSFDENATILELNGTDSGLSYVCISIPSGVVYDMDMEMENCQFHMFMKHKNKVQKATILLNRCKGMAKDIMLNGICPAKYFKVLSSGSENIRFEMQKAPSCTVELPSAFVWRKHYV